MICDINYERHTKPLQVFYAISEQRWLKRTIATPVVIEANGIECGWNAMSAEVRHRCTRSVLTVISMGILPLPPMINTACAVPARGMVIFTSLVMVAMEQEQWKVSMAAQIVVL